MNYVKNCNNYKEETMKYLNEFLYEDIDLKHLSFQERCAYKGLKAFGEYLDFNKVDFPTDDWRSNFMMLAAFGDFTDSERNEVNIALQMFINYCFEHRKEILSGRFKNRKFNNYHVYNDDGVKLYDFVDPHFPLAY